MYSASRVASLRMGRRRFVWFGIGEASKIVLIFYTGVFIVTLNTIAGVASIPDSRLRTAESLGANRWQVLTRIVPPRRSRTW